MSPLRRAYAELLELEQPPEVVTQPGIKEWWIAATHESGHAVAHISLKRPFSSVEVYLSDDKTAVIGAVTGERRSVAAAQPPFSHLHLAICCLAGPVSESRYSGADLDEVFRDSSATDLSMAKAAIARDPTATLEAALRATKRLVTYEWPRVQRLTGELVRYRQLDYSECLQLVGDQ